MKKISQIIPRIKYEIYRYFKREYENRYKNNEVKFIFRNKLGVLLYVHPQKLFDIIELGNSCDAEPMMAALDEIVSGSNIVLDVGANIGIVTAWLSKKARVVYAFEPEISNLNGLKENLELNGASNVIAHELAVGAENGRADFHSLQQQHITKTSEVRSVKVVKLDDFCEEKKIIDVDVLKIDVEGGEFDVLQGFLKYLSTGKVKMVIFEHAPILIDNDLSNRLEVFVLLEQYGYRVYDLNHKEVTKETMHKAAQGDYYAVLA
jgi:FkbM family methyltransferase